MNTAETLQKKMIRLVLPIAFQQFMLALVGASDAVMLGRLNQNSMAAVSLASQVTFVFNLFMAAFVIGENMFVAQYYGKKDYDNISRVVSLVLCTSCIVAVLFVAGSMLVPVAIMRVLTNEPELVVMGSEYLRAVGVSYFLSAVAQVYLTFMKNCNAVNLSTAVSSVAVVLNIVLNAVLIFGLLGFPALGIKGAAIATVIAMAVQMVWSVVYVSVKMRWIRISIRKYSQELVERFWQKTAPILLNELVWGGGFTMYSVVMGHMGTDAVAANSIANISKNLVVCLCLGLGSAGSIIVGNELGADHFEEAKEAGKNADKGGCLMRRNVRNFSGGWGL
ncbi:MAG: MATE family efflux transporter [Eubacterium sp.]|nr:MATE family efflux transporter [Eubacterium sp.]